MWTAAADYRPGGACAAGMKKEFLIAFRAGEPAGPHAQDLQACAAGRFGDAFNGALVQFGVAHDPAFADIAAIEFELGFHQNEEFGVQARRAAPPPATPWQRK